jgi:hypothetical protein
VPAAERAAVAGQLFGEECSIAMSRIDTATVRQATEDVLAFGVASPASVTVVARTCAEADAWATALMVLGLEKGAVLARKHGLDALFHLRDDEGTARGVGVGRLFSEKPAAIASARGR